LRTLAKATEGDRKVSKYLKSAVKGMPVYVASLSIALDVAQAFRGSPLQCEELLCNILRPYEGTLAELLEEAPRSYLAANELNVEEIASDKEAAVVMEGLYDFMLDLAGLQD